MRPHFFLKETFHEEKYPGERMLSLSLLTDNYVSYQATRNRWIILYLNDLSNSQLMGTTKKCNLRNEIGLSVIVSLV